MDPISVLEAREKSWRCRSEFEEDLNRERRPPSGDLQSVMWHKLTWRLFLRQRKNLHGDKTGPAPNTRRTRGGGVKKKKTPRRFLSFIRCQNTSALFPRVKSRIAPSRKRISLALAVSARLFWWVSEVTERKALARLTAERRWTVYLPAPTEAFLFTEDTKVGFHLLVWVRLHIKQAATLCTNDTGNPKVDNFSQRKYSGTLTWRLLITNHFHMLCLSCVAP